LGTSWSKPQPRQLALSERQLICYTSAVSEAAQKLVNEALQLSEDERLNVASELIASVDGPADEDWDACWLAELERRTRAAAQRGQPAPEWSAVRKRILDRVAKR